MSVKATRHKHDTSRKEKALLDKIYSYDDDCPEITAVCAVMDFALSLHEAGWKVKVAPFEDVPILKVKGTKKTRKGEM